MNLAEQCGEFLSFEVLKECGRRLSDVIWQLDEILSSYIYFSGAESEGGRCHGCLQTPGVTLNYPTVSIHTGVGITREENAPNKTNPKGLLSAKWISEALSLLSAVRILQEGLSHSLVLSTLFLYLKDSFIPKGKVDYTIPPRLGSSHMPWHHLAFLNYPIFIWVVFHWKTDRWDLCLLPKGVAVGFWVLALVLFWFFK